MAEKKELEIGLKATGGAAAAKEIEKVEEAVVDLNAEAAQSNRGTPLFDWGPPVKEGREEVEAATVAVEDLGTTVTETVPVLDDLTDAANDMSGSFNMGGSAVAGGGKNLMGFVNVVKGAASKISLFVAAGKAGWDTAKKVGDRLEEIDEVANRALPTLARTSQHAAISQAALATSVDATARATRDGEAAFAAYAKRLRSMADEQAGLIDAQLGLELAQIDLGELNGNLSEAEAIQSRFNAKQSAKDLTLKTEREAIETELNNRRMQNEQDWQTYLDTQDPVRDAQARHAETQRRGASGAPELADLTTARNAANNALAGASKFARRETIEQLEAEAAKAQAALAEGFEKLVAERIKAVDKALADAVAAEGKVAAGQSDQRRLERELEGVTTGPSAQVNAMRDREAGLRNEADLLRVQQAEEKRADDLEAAANRTANRAAIDSDGQALAGEIMSKVSGADGDKNPALIASLKQIAALLGNGTNEGELTSITGQLVTLTDGLSAEQSASKAVVAQLKNQVDALLSRERNNQN